MFTSPDSSIFSIWPVKSTSLIGFSCSSAL